MPKTEETTNREKLFSNAFLLKLKRGYLVKTNIKMQFLFLQIAPLFMEQFDVMFDKVEEVSWRYCHHTMTAFLFSIVKLENIKHYVLHT